jgi:predicted nucleotide-binding protein
MFAGTLERVTDFNCPPSKAVKQEVADSKPASLLENSSALLPPSSMSSSLEVTHLRNKIFIVHGHDNVTLLELQNFLWRHGYEPIVLKDERDGGDTIIEKLERI